MDVDDSEVKAEVEEDDSDDNKDSEQVKELKVCGFFLSSQRSAIHIFS
jgi:hypothetical protein